MTPRFTTPCYVRIDDAQQRKEVCEKLSEIGYKNIAIKDDEWILTQCESTNVEWLIEYMKTAIECFDIPTFLDLAGMRSDTCLNQWFVYRKKIYNYSDCDSRVKQKINSGFGRYATAQEIIEWHKQKGGIK